MNIVIDHILNPRCFSPQKDMKCILNPNAPVFNPVVENIPNINDDSRSEEYSRNSELLSLNSSSNSINLDGRESEEPGPFNTLKNIRVSNVNRLIIGQLNINSLRNKFEALKFITVGNIDILVITESKLDHSFPVNQFLMDGYSPPFRLDRDSTGGGIIIYVREDIPCRELRGHQIPNNLESIFLEINHKKYKWLLFGGYNPNKDNIINFVNYVTPVLDYYMTKYDNFLLLGDFNSEMSESTMGDFCDTYNLTNLVTDPTCFKNPCNPSLIDLILTNRARRFQDSCVIETDHHKLTIIVLRAHFLKQAPITINYRDYKRFDQIRFRNELLEKLSNINGGKLDYDTFEGYFVDLLDKHAPSKKKYIGANSSPFMNKTLSKAVMTRSRLRNKFLKNPNNVNRTGYTKYRNYCTRLFKKEKKAFYNNLDTTLITDNRKFRKTVKPLFLKNTSVVIKSPYSKMMK